MSSNDQQTPQKLNQQAYQQNAQASTNNGSNKVEEGIVKIGHNPDDLSRPTPPNYKWHPVEPPASATAAPAKNTTNAAHTGTSAPTFNVSLLHDLRTSSMDVAFATQTLINKFEMQTDLEKLAVGQSGLKDTSPEIKALARMLKNVAKEVEEVAEALGALVG